MISVLIVAMDQAAKYLVLTHLDLYESVQPIRVLAPYFQITRSYNTGIAFGLFAQIQAVSQLLLMVVVAILALLFYTYARLPINRWGDRWALALVIGGAVGNLIDRIVYGHVIDFIHYRIPGVVSNVSNIADHVIVLGVLLLVMLPKPVPNDVSASDVTDLDAMERDLS